MNFIDKETGKAAIDLRGKTVSGYTLTLRREAFSEIVTGPVDIIELGLWFTDGTVISIKDVDCEGRPIDVEVISKGKQ